MKTRWQRLHPRKRAAPRDAPKRARPSVARDGYLLCGQCGAEVLHEEADYTDIVAVCRACAGEVKTTT